MTARKAISNKDMNGLKINNLGTPAVGSDAARKTDVDNGITTATSRANHTGTQTAATISDFDAQARTSRLDQFAAPTAPVSFNSQRITSLLDPTAAQDAATKNYVDVSLAGVATGMTLKGVARAAVTSNVTIASPGTTLDGLTAGSTEIFLLTGQSTGSENGPYIWNGAASAMTRALNWDTNAEAVKGSYWVITEGSKADSFALLTTDTAVVVGTTATTFTFISVAGAAIGRFTGTTGAITAGASGTITHSLGSKDVAVSIYRTASPFDDVTGELYFERTSTSVITLFPDVAIASGEFTVVVKY